MENRREVPQKLKIELPHDSAISFLGLQPKETESVTRRDTCISVFTAALYTKGKTWKQPKWPSTEEWIKKML